MELKITNRSHDYIRTGISDYQFFFIFLFQAELPPEQVEPVDLSIKIKVITNHDLPKPNPELKPQLHVTAGGFDHKSSIPFYLPQTPDTPRHPFPIPALAHGIGSHLSPLNLPHSSDPSSVHSLFKASFLYENNNNLSSKVPSYKKEQPAVPPLIIASPSYPLHPLPVPSTSGHIDVSIPSSSHYDYSTTQNKLMQYGGLQMFPSLNFSPNSPPQSPTIPSLPITCPKVSPISIPSITSPTTSSQLISTKSTSPPTNNNVKEQCPPQSRSSSISKEETKNPSQSTISSTTISPGALSVKTTESLKINVLDSRSPSSVSKAAPGEVSPKNLPSAVSDTSAITPVPTTSLPPSLGFPPHFSQEALANFMKEHHAHPHFPLTMAHFPTGLPIPVPFNSKGEQGE